MMFSERFPSLSHRLKDGVDPTVMPAQTHKKIEIRCMGENCHNYVEKRPDGMARYVKEPLIFCSNKACQSQRRMNITKRRVKKGNSLTEKFPTLASQLLGKDPNQVSWRDSSIYEFTCINCGDSIMLSPKTIKDGSDRWAPFCKNKNCAKAQKTIKTSVCKERGSYAKLAKHESESFAFLYPLVAQQQHKNCSIDLATLKPKSNQKIMLACTGCGSPVHRVVNKIDGHEKFFCNSSECKTDRNNYIRTLDWKTRINTRGSFEDKFPHLAEEWVKCLELPHLRPSDIPPNVRLLVKWQCRENEEHIWQRRVDGRANNPGCPFCSSNVSKMQLRFASEIAHLMDIKIKHSSKILIDGRPIEVDIPIILGDGRKFAIEVDGYKWHKDRKQQHYEKDKILKDNLWKVIRVRDDRLPEMKSCDRNILVPSNSFYDDEWRQAIVQILDYMNVPKPYQYDGFVAQQHYESLLKYYKLGGG